MSLRSMQMTLALIKPDAAKVPYVVQSIHNTILSEGFLVVMRATMQLSLPQASKFYAEHRERFFYNRLVTFMSSGPLEALVLLREDAVGKWRELMGPTKVYHSWHTHPNSIRGMWGLTDTRNTTHGSDSPENALKEIAFFFPEFDVSKWNKQNYANYCSGTYRFDEELFMHKPV